MRIIGGHLGGRRLRAPRGDDTRPTSDRVREAVFNIAGPPPPGARVLDAFAGSGALGLEALSRGATFAVFADTAHAACRCVRENARALALDHAIRVHRGDAIALIARLTETAPDSSPADIAAGDAAADTSADASADGPPGRDGPFHWVFLDPPYRSDLASRALSALGDGALVADGGIVVVEHDRRRPPDATCGCLIRTDCRRYGDTGVSLYRRAESTPR